MQMIISHRETDQQNFDGKTRVFTSRSSRQSSLPSVQTISHALNRSFAANGIDKVATGQVQAPRSPICWIFAEKTMGKFHAFLGMRQICWNASGVVGSVCGDFEWQSTTHELHQISRWTLWTAHASWKPQWFKSGPWILAAHFSSLDLLSWQPSLVWIYWKTCSPVAPRLVFRRPGFLGMPFFPVAKNWDGILYIIILYDHISSTFWTMWNAPPIHRLVPGLKLPSPKTLTQGYEAWQLILPSISYCIPLSLSLVTLLLPIVFFFSPLFSWKIDI